MKRLLVLLVECVNNVKKKKKTLKFWIWTLTRLDLDRGKNWEKFKLLYYSQPYMHLLSNGSWKSVMKHFFLLYYEEYA